MERRQTLAIGVLLVLVLVTGSFAAGYSMGEDAPGSPASSSSTEGLGVISDAYRKIRSSAVDRPTREQLARGAVRGMVDSLREEDDPYALFYGPDGYRSFQEITNGQFSGIGVWLKQKEEGLEIVSVLPSTPALEEGLQHGDVIEAIDGQDVDGLTVDESVNLIKGPPGSQVELDISREGIPMSFEITRRSIELPNLQARTTPEDLGYIRLFGFARGAGTQLRRKVGDLTSAGVEGFVLDLRDNGGGLFSEAIDVASVFIERGKVVTYKTRREPDQVFEARGSAYDEVPLVVLVNEGTASASEIVAGALQDRDRAILVGEKTYGKGSVQEVFPLADSSALKFTTGTYFTPAGNDIDGSGIRPDVEVTGEPEEQRDRAVEILRGIVLSTEGAQG